MAERNLAENPLDPATENVFTSWAAVAAQVEPHLAGGSTNLDGLADVVITAAASGDILRHNGTAWVDTPGTTHFDAAGTAAAAVSVHESTSGVHGISAFGATLVDDADAATARATLGLGGVATLNVGTTTGTVAAGDDSRITGALQTSSAAELIRDTIGTALAGSGRITVTPNDGADTITVTTDATKVSVATYSSGWPARPSADLVIWVSSDRSATTPAGATGDDIVILPSPLVPLMFALSDESTAITTGTAKLTARAPYAFTLSAVRASVNTVSSSGVVTVDINKNGTTVMSTNKLSIDASEKTSVTAATAAGISSSSFADDDEITFDIDAAGTGAKGLKVTLLVVPT